MPRPRITPFTARRFAALALVAIVLGVRPGAGEPAPASAAVPGAKNLVLIVTDDQTATTLPHTPAVMPWLQARLSDPTDHWVWFPNTFTNTALCCPARATLLTGRYSHRHRVQNNTQGQNLNESSTLATWLDGAGYQTALIGKYLNGYPWGRGDYVPPGWDRWAAFLSGSYTNFTLLEDGTRRSYAAYSTDLLADKAVDFVETATDDPWFLHFTPAAPHSPFTPAARHNGSFDSLPAEHTPAYLEPDVSDKPAWVRKLTIPSDPKFDRDRRNAYETLLAVDEAIERIVGAIEARGELDETVIAFVSDNGYAFGENRWKEKRCGYDVCIRVPLAIRYPGAAPGPDGRLVGNVDLVPTLAAAAGVTPPLTQNGLSLVPVLEGGSPPWRDALLIRWAGGGGIPAYWGLRTPDFAYFELSTGEVELYDITGALGTADPYQLQNRCPGNPPSCATAYRSTRTELSSKLAQLKSSS